MQQVAALPFVPRDGGFEILLVTSRRDGRWIVPKGWPEKGEALHESAAREAREEAGAYGDVCNQPVGAYTYSKTMSAGYRVSSHVHVYPLLVRDCRDDWPERDARKRRWAGLTEAAALVGDRGLANLLAGLAEDDGAALRDACRALDPQGVAAAAPATLTR